MNYLEFDNYIELENNDSFDISRFPKYYFELKKAAILSLSRDEFLDFFIGEHFALSNGFVSYNRTIESKKIKEYLILKKHIYCERKE